MNRYETHLTLAADDASSWVAVRRWAESSRLKWTQIVLDAGETPVQPMITFWGTESLAESLRRADELTREIQTMGGSVVRLKVEADVTNDDVPQTDTDMAPESAGYFEHHVKVLLSDSSNVAQLSERAAACDGRLSQNTRRVRADGQAERFVTQRVYDRGRNHSRRKLDHLLSELSAAAFSVLEIEEEYVVFDSNLAIDAGWLEREERTHGTV